VLASSLDILDNLIVDDFVSNLERFILLILLTCKKNVIHTETPTIKFSDFVPRK
jgi:hypothetical protein